MFWRWKGGGGLGRGFLEWFLIGDLVTWRPAVEWDLALTSERERGGRVEFRDEGGPFGSLPQ